MTENAGDLATLEPLEPLDAGGAGGAPGGATSDEALLQAMRSGLPAPAFNPYCRDKAYYKFLWAGIIMLLGCLMPFDANQGAAGWQTMSGAIYTIIALGMIKTWWGAINTNRSAGASLFWLLACMAPLIAGAMNMSAFEPAEAAKAAMERGWVHGNFAYPDSWKAMFGDMGTGLGKSADAGDAAARVGNFWRLFGTGQFFVFFGALFAELGFIGGIFGGMKKNKELKQAKQMAAAERKRGGK